MRIETSNLQWGFDKIKFYMYLLEKTTLIGK